MTRRAQIFVGAGLALIYTVLITSADGITKEIGQTFAAPQLFAASGVIVAGLCLLAARFQPTQAAAQSWTTTCPRAMAMRAGLTVCASVAFFYAFALLPFAQVFVFVGLMPLIAAALAGPVLHETVRPVAWIALCFGFLGVLVLFAQRLEGPALGHLVALCAALCGTGSILASRYIGQHEMNGLAQVFYPNLALGILMGSALPWVYRPMTVGQWGLVAVYSLALFAARWALVSALRRLPAHVVLPLMNLQFVWMVLVGVWVFGEMPGYATFLGACIVGMAGAAMILHELLPSRAVRLHGKTGAATTA